MKRLISIALLLLAAPALAGAADPQRQYKLAIGDPARRDREVPVPFDAIVDTSTGDVITPDQLPARLTGVRLLLLGESHTSTEFHRVQYRALRALHEAGRRVLVGLEMYPYTEQRFLDQWRDGLLTEEGFLRLSRWYEHWGYHWMYYRDIFLFAREQRLPMYAVNTPRDVVTAVRKKGFANLTAEEAAHIPKDIDVTSADHMTYFKSSFDEADALHGGMTDDAWKAMLSAQATWDATMGYNAVQALAQHPEPEAIMVVLVGFGHVAYGVGIERQVRAWFDGGIASLIPVPVLDSEREPIKSVRASFANFVWGVASEADTAHPTLGVSTTAAEGGRKVIQVEKGSVGERAGFQVGDQLLKMDGTPVPDRESYSRLMATKAWGDAATFLVRRGGEERTLVANFRRSVPLPAPAAKAPGDKKKPAARAVKP
jgi:uncharacterized iron-regulated protein